MSPDGRMLAYTEDRYASTVFFTDATGRGRPDFELKPEDTITGLDWDYPDVLAVATHFSPNASEFTFIDVSSGMRIAGEGGTNAVGSSCALAPNQKDTACAIADSLSVDGNVIYYAAGPFVRSATLQTLTIAPGKTVSTDTTPVYRVRITQIVDDEVGIRVTPPNGAWQTEYLQLGKSMQCRSIRKMANGKERTGSALLPLIRRVER